MDYAPPTGLAIELNGVPLLCEPSGALWWPGEGTLVVADLHLEKGSSFAQRGVMLPPYDTLATLERLAAAVRPDLRRVICLGDSFHDSDGPLRLAPGDWSRLAALTGLADWIWIAGNHDPSPPAWLGGTITSEIAIGGLVFRHEPTSDAPAGEVAGHLHPCATVVRRGRGLRRRCFVSDGARLLLPSFGAYTGGLDIWERAIASLFPDAFLAYMLGARRVYAVAATENSHALWRKNRDEIQPSSTATMTANRP